MDTILQKLEYMESVLTKALMPSIKAPKPPSVAQTPTAPEIPANPAVPSSKKNPVKVAQQIQDPSIKQQQVKAAKQQIKTLPNGQWKLV